MNRRRALLAFAGVTAGALAPQFTTAADPGQRVVQIGFVSQGSASSGELYFNPFRERLEQLGYVLVVNERAAKALRLPIPRSILLRADEVIR